MIGAGGAGTQQVRDGERDRPDASEFVKKLMLREKPGLVATFGYIFSFFGDHNPDS